MPYTFKKTSENWDENNKDFNKGEAAEIELVTSPHLCTEI
jgi:hypothetical protein